MRWCWVNFQFRVVLLILIVVGQGPTALAFGASECRLDIFSLVYHFFFLSPSFWETARYRLKYCLKGPLSPKPTNQILTRVKEMQKTGINTIKSRIPYSKLKGKDAHTQTDKRSHKTRTGNRIHRFYPNMWSFSYPV